MFYWIFYFHFLLYFLKNKTGWQGWQPIVGQTRAEASHTPGPNQDLGHGPPDATATAVAAAEVGLDLGQGLDPDQGQSDILGRGPDLGQDRGDTLGGMAAGGPEVWVRPVPGAEVGRGHCAHGHAQGQNHSLPGLKCHKGKCFLDIPEKTVLYIQSWKVRILILEMWSHRAKPTA